MQNVGKTQTQRTCKLNAPTDLSHGVPPPDCGGPVLERPHRLLARQQVVGPVRRPLQVVWFQV